MPGCEIKAVSCHHHCASGAALSCYGLGCRMARLKQVTSHADIEIVSVQTGSTCVGDKERREREEEDKGEASKRSEGQGTELPAPTVPSEGLRPFWYLHGFHPGSSGKSCPLSDPHHDSDCFTISSLPAANPAPPQPPGAVFPAYPPITRTRLVFTGLPALCPVVSYFHLEHLSKASSQLESQLQPCLGWLSALCGGLFPRTLYNRSLAAFLSLALLGCMCVCHLPWVCSLSLSQIHVPLSLVPFLSQLSSIPSLNRISSSQIPCSLDITWAPPSPSYTVC